MRNNLPTAPSARRNNVHSEISARALARWNPSIQAAASETASISILDAIGQDYWTGEGVTAKRIESALRAIGEDTPINVTINSPGGDMFEGLAIYNLLKEHKAPVNIKVIGVAASAASVIAMAGDTVEIARAGFFMIHNAWVLAAGNRHDLREVSDWLEPFDEVMADIYAARTGLDKKAVAKLMDSESWIGGQSAVDDGFADSLLQSDEIEQREGAKALSSVRRIEGALRASGMPKSEAVALIAEFKAALGDPSGSSKGDPAEHGKHAVALKETAALAESLKNLI
jgi:ATP-dependent Clp protease protease subunit